MDHVRALADEVGSRPASSEQEGTAAAYLLHQFEQAGYDARIQSFDFSIDRAADVRIAGSSLNGAEPMVGAAAGTATAPLSYVRFATNADLTEPLDGRIALAERGSIAFGEKAMNAERAGALALVVINDSDSQLFGRLQTVTDIPVVSVPAAAGEILRQTASTGGRVTVAIETNVTRPSQNVVARPPDGGDCEVVVGGHYDSVPAGPGANDNASGTATMLSVAETRAVRGELDDVCYVAFGAEELGLHGSLAFVNQMDDAELAALRGMINLDMVGIRQVWSLIGTPEMQELAAAVAASLGIQAAAYELPQQFDSDHTPFRVQGVPVIFFHGDRDSRYHTPNDRSEFVEQRALDEAGRMTLAVIDRLLDSN